jgi:hypothetical protein
MIVTSGCIPGIIGDPTPTSTTDTSTLSNTDPTAATQLIWTTSPSGGVAGVVWASQGALKLVNSSGAVVTSGTDSTATITLTLLSGTGSLLGTSTATASAGLISLAGNNLKMNIAGVKTIRATYGSLTADQTLTITPAPAASLTVQSFPSPVAAGTSNGITVTAYDTFGNVATGYTGTVAFTTTSASKTLPSNYTFVAGDSGTKTFSGVILGTVGTQSITATDTVTATITGSQTLIDVQTAVSFATASENVAIHQGSAAITVNLSASLGSALNIPINVSASSTAVLNTDYTLPAASLTIPAGQTTGTFTVNLIDQKSPATPNATVILSIGTLTGAMAGTIQTDTLTIRTPSLDLNFTELVNSSNPISTSPYSLITFSRSSSGTYVDADGFIKNANSNIPRIDHHPTTGQVRGLLLEESRTNLVTYSSQFAHSSWTSTNISLSNRAVTAPDFTRSVYKMIANTTNSTHTVGKSYSYTAVGQNACQSIFVKKADYNYITLATTGTAFAPTYATARFDLVAGTVAATSGVPLTSGIQAFANGWYRVYLCQTTTAISSGQFLVQVTNNTPATSFAGDNTSGTYIWGAQLEIGTYPTSYIPTQANTVTRSADSASINPLGAWYTAGQGTLLAEGVFNYYESGKSPPFVRFSDGTSNNIISLFYDSTTRLRHLILSGGASQLDSSATNYAYTLGNLFRLAMSYSSTRGYANANLGTLTSVTNPTLPTLDRLEITSSSQSLNGALSRITYLLTIYIATV